MVEQKSRSTELQILAYAPTEFFHCQHCEVVWNQVGIGQRFHAEQRGSGLLPPELADEYAAISDWVAESVTRYGAPLSIKTIDAVSLEGVWKKFRYRVQRFPAFILSGGKSSDGDRRWLRIEGFDRRRLDAALAERFGAVSEPGE